jgi:hypothetical protein
MAAPVNKIFREEAWKSFRRGSQYGRILEIDRWSQPAFFVVAGLFVIAAVGTALIPIRDQMSGTALARQTPQGNGFVALVPAKPTTASGRARLVVGTQACEVQLDSQVVLTAAERAALATSSDGLTYAIGGQLIDATCGLLAGGATAIELQLPARALALVLFPVLGN